MKKNIDEVKKELSERIANGYKLSGENEALLRSRLRAKNFLDKRFKVNHRVSDTLKLNEIKTLAEEYMENGELSVIIAECYDLGFYKGYMKAKAEMKANSTDCH